MKVSSINKAVFGILCVCAAAAVCGCSKKTDNGSVQKITFVLDWTPNTNHTGLYVAQEKKWFAEEGLDVTFVQPPEDGAPLMTASGKAQFGIDAQDTLAPAFAKDDALPVTAVAALLQHNTSGIISLKSAKIDRPAALSGKRYSTWENPVELAIIKNIVQSDGGDFSKISLIPSTVYDVITALNSGDTDSVWIFYGWDGIACRERNIETNFINLGEINPVFDYYTPVIIVNNDFLKKNPSVVKKFLTAAARGYEYAAANSEESADILCKAAPELESSMVHASQVWISKQYIADAEKWGYINSTRWDAFYNWLYSEGLVTKDITSTKHYSDEYLAD